MAKWFQKKYSEPLFKLGQILATIAGLWMASGGLFFNAANQNLGLISMLESNLLSSIDLSENVTLAQTQLNQIKLNSTSSQVENLAQMNGKYISFAFDQFKIGTIIAGIAMLAGLFGIFCTIWSEEN